MSKITFRADDELITQLEEFDDSKSEIMRRALREYLDSHTDEMGETGTGTTTANPDTGTDSETLDDLVTERVDALIADRLNGAFTPSQPQDINVNITLDGQKTASVQEESERVYTEPETSHERGSDVSHTAEPSKTVEEDSENTRVQQGSTCSQCGENVDPSHVHCPNCGEKTSHRVFCDCGDEIRSDWGFCPSCGRRTPAADVLDQP